MRKAEDISAFAKPLAATRRLESVTGQLHRRISRRGGHDGDGGRGGIRTHGTVSRTPVFKTGSLNHSDTLPSN